MFILLYILDHKIIQDFGLFSSTCVPLGIVFGITVELLNIFICQRFSTQFEFGLIPILFYLVISLVLARRAV